MLRPYTLRPWRSLRLIILSSVGSLCRATTFAASNFLNLELLSH
jgi:hypothetical protein